MSSSSTPASSTVSCRYAAQIRSSDAPLAASSVATAIGCRMYGSSPPLTLLTAVRTFREPQRRPRPLRVDHRTSLLRVRPGRCRRHAGRIRGRPTCNTIWACRLSGIAAGSPSQRRPSTCAVTEPRYCANPSAPERLAPDREQVAERVAGAGHLDHAGRLTGHDRMLAGARLDVRHRARPMAAGCRCPTAPARPTRRRTAPGARRTAPSRRCAAGQRRPTRPRRPSSVKRSPTPIGRGSGAYPALPQAASSRLMTIAAASGRSDRGEHVRCVRTPGVAVRGNEPRRWDKLRPRAFRCFRGKRRRPESNWCGRLCRPLPSHSATSPCRRQCSDRAIAQVHPTGRRRPARIRR